MVFTQKSCDGDDNDAGHGGGDGDVVDYGDDDSDIDGDVYSPDK